MKDFRSENRKLAKNSEGKVLQNEKDTKEEYDAQCYRSNPNTVQKPKSNTMLRKGRIGRAANAEQAVKDAERFYSL